MPELRQNIITTDWVIISSERAKRPDQFVREKRATPPLPSYQADCPFCLGNEHMTMQESFRVGNEKTWRVRAIPNKYPALAAEGARVRKANGIYRSMTGVGHHEVIVEHPRHDLTTAQYSEAEVVDILRAYHQRYTEIKKDPRVEAIIVFKNHGEGAGTSLQHPHSQLAATPMVPSQIRKRIEEATRFFDDNGECLFCRTLNEELAAGERIVLETEHFVAFVPYAALSPFHLWIFPRRHASAFDEITDPEITDLARNLRTILAKMYCGLNDPDYNYSIRSIPTRDRHTDYFHWYLTIIPRITKTAGFELGSGMYINSSLPEESARFLRDITVSPNP
jgi:UDPglucose--hexose-1-phosphate uridylyltransferase